MQLYSTATTYKKSRFILSERLEFHMSDDLLTAFHAFPKRTLTLLSIDKILLPS